MSQIMHSKLAAPPDVLRWSSRSGDHGDCVIAALEIACGVTYEKALRAALQAAPNVLDEGMWWSEAKKAAKRLGFIARSVRAGSFDLDEATGILHVYQPRGGDRFTRGRDSSHAVYLWEGRIIEPKADRRQLWKHAEQYLKHYSYRAGSLLVLEPKDDQ